MDVDEAWRVLGLQPGDRWDAVRVAYRRLIVEVHPDRAGDRSGRRAAQVNQAYAVLVRARRAERSPPARPADTPPPPPQAPGTRRTAGTFADDGTLVVTLDLTTDDAFYRLLAAGDTIGAIGYVDRQSEVFEVLVRHGGEVCSLLVTFETVAGRVEASLTLEALERAASLAPQPVVRRLLDAVDTT